MIIHLTTSKRSLVEEIDTLRQIVKLIEAKGHTVAGNWIESAYKNALKNIPPDLTKTYRQSMEEVNKADAIIAEVTHSSFGVGYQVATAIHQKKPTLLLSQEGAETNALIKGLDNKVVQYRAYNKATLPRLVEDFIEENDIQAQDLRFNFFIDRQIYNYLRWTSHKTGKTKARILRELVLKEIQKEED